VLTRISIEKWQHRRMASPPPPRHSDDANEKGILAGVCIGFLASLIATIALAGQQTILTTALAWVSFVGPLAVGLVLAWVPRTRRFGLGLLLGAFITLIVCGGPLATCASSLRELG
jgi:ABC-type Mn2+/Zn2+ transport system permease subunit